MTSTWKGLAAAIVGAAGLTAGAASAATYTFNAVGPSVDWLTIDNFTISPGAYGNLNNGHAQITQTASGLGVNGLPDSNAGNIDGYPHFSTEYLRITFDDPVRLLGFTLGNVDGNDDVNVYFDDALDGVYNVVSDNPFDVDRIVSSFIVKATGSNDDFTLAGFQVAPVPLPAAGFLLVGGLGALAALRRRRAAMA
jgi:hypothetical protein